MRYDKNAISNTARNLCSKSSELSIIQTSLSRVSPKKCSSNFYLRRSSLVKRLSNVQSEINALGGNINNAASKMSSDDVQNAYHIRQALSNRTSKISYRQSLFSTGDITLKRCGVFGSTLLFSQTAMSRRSVSSLGNVSPGSTPWYSKVGILLRSGAASVGEKVSEFGSKLWNGASNFFSNAGKWASERLNDLRDWGNSAGEYTWKSITKFVLGDYSDDDITALSFAGNIVTGIFGVDLPLDVRDLVYDIQHWGEQDNFGVYFALDVVALLPVIGTLKYSKYADDVADGAKDLGKILEAGADAGKTTDTVVDSVDNVTDVGKKADAVTDAGKIAKDIPKKSLSELPENVQESYKKYEDVNWNGNFKNATPGTKAGKEYRNGDGLLPGVDENGNSITYKEYDVNNLPKEASSRDRHRFVRGSDGSVYYTSDHFMTFIKLE